MRTSMAGQGVAAGRASWQQILLHSRVCKGQGGRGGRLLQRQQLRGQIRQDLRPTPQPSGFLMHMPMPGCAGQLCYQG